MQRREFSLEDLYEHRLVRDLHLSPDGKRIAYELKTVDRDADGYKSQVRVVEVETGVDQRFTRGDNDALPRWSPDGRWLAFLSDRGGKPGQLFVMPVGGGEARAVGTLPHAVMNYAWSPDSKSFLLTTTVDDEEPPKDEKARKRWQERPVHITRQHYKSDGSGFTVQRIVQAFALDLDGGEPRQLTQGRDDVGSPAWSPDGSQIVYSRARPGPREGHCQDLWIASADGSNPRRVTSEIATARGPVWSPDGRWIAFAGSREPGDARNLLWLYDTRENRVRQLGDEHVEVSSFPLVRSHLPSWSADSRRLAALVSRRGASQAVVLYVPDGKVLARIGGQRQLTCLHAGPRLAFCGGALDDPGGIGVAEWSGEDEKRVHAPNRWWEERAAPRPERKSFRMEDGASCTAGCCAPRRSARRGRS